MPVTANPYAEDINVDTPPASVADGTVYGIGPNPTGAWEFFPGGVAVENSETDGGWDLSENLKQRKLLIKKNGLLYFGDPTNGWTPQANTFGTQILGLVGDRFTFLYEQFRSCTAFVESFPFEPAAGAVAIVKPTGTGDFTGHDNETAVSNGPGNGYTFYPPILLNPVILENGTDHAFLVWNGSVMERFDITVTPPTYPVTIVGSSLYKIESGQSFIIPPNVNLLVFEELTDDGILTDDGRLCEVN